MPPRIVILGAGPTGLGAACRLRELGYDNWHLYEKAPTAGGLSGSITDANGFTWDYGGHVLFSTFTRVDRLLDSLGTKFFHHHQRRAYIRLHDCFIPYPFQQHLDELPASLREFILHTNDEARPDPGKTKNFFQWLTATFGHGPGEIFFYPYNHKVWGHDLEKMSYSWVTQRISPAEQDRNRQWGPNSTFLYPRQGGMGGLFRSLAARFPKAITYDAEVVAVDTRQGRLKTADGRTDSFDYLVSSLPLTHLLQFLEPAPPEPVTKAGGFLAWNSCTVTGVGLARPAKTDFTWLYYPEPEYPFYRVTALSNYAASLVPQSNHSAEPVAFMCETTTRSAAEPSPDAVVSGLQQSQLRPNPTEPLTLTRMRLPLAYPIPTLDRDQNLHIIQEYLASQRILSRGRFGGWKYEIGNMDHSLIQGIEAIDRILLQQPETVYTSC
jgi:protoporphyrinogen oxidase